MLFFQKLTICAYLQLPQAGKHCNQFFRCGFLLASAKMDLYQYPESFESS
jgi:hypothetical protein